MFTVTKVYNIYRISIILLCFLIFFKSFAIIEGDGKLLTTVYLDFAGRIV